MRDLLLVPAAVGAWARPADDESKAGACQLPDSQVLIDGEQVEGAKTSPANTSESSCSIDVK